MVLYLKTIFRLRRTAFLIFIFLLSSTLLHAGNQKRVYADIVGDLLHAGHIEFFKKARAHGDYLIIGVLSDEDVESYKRVPILTLHERVEIIKACKYVDEVIVAPPLRTTEKWLKEHQIDVVVHGDDLDEKLQMDQYKIPIKMGIFKTVPYTEGVSTTNIIQRIKERYIENRQR